MDIWNYLQTAQKPIIMYGTGNGADKILKILKSYGVSVSGVFASDGFVRDRIFAGFKVKSYTEIKAEFGDFIILVAFGSSRPEVIENVKRLQSENELYAPDVPVFGDNIFNEAFYQQNRQRIEAIYNSLEDGISKKAFENTVKYKLSGKTEYLFECETPEKELFDILDLKQNECYFDLGAYTGDTVSKFKNKVGNYRKIVAVEPDTKSFKKLKLTTANYRDTETINACISGENGTAEFEMRGGRSSSIGQGKKIKAVTIDALCQKDIPTFIKFDIEGNEFAAIKGGIKTISRHKPKLLLAAYHRSEDLFLLPEQVLKINPDYKLYFRHNPSVLSWDSNFIFL